MNVARGGTQPGRRVTTLLLVCLATSVAIAAGARAVGPTTTLTPQGCVDDNDSGDDACAWSTNGLDAAHSVAVSPDGESVYAASLGDNAIVHLSRSATTGALTPAGCVDDNDPEGPDACAQSTDGLEGAASVAVSSDGESVYAAGLLDDAIVGFDRNTTTGELTPAGCVEDDDTGDGACAQSTDGLDGPSSVTVSPDGRSVYAASFTDDAIVRFDRDTTTGALTPAGCVDDNDPPEGPDDCAQSTNGLDDLGSVAVSRDGKSVYGASFGDSAIARFTRSTTGAITPAGCVDDNDGEGRDACARSTNGLDAAISVTVSPDGESVYATGVHDDAIVAFARNTTTGTLTPAGCVDDEQTGDDVCARSKNGLNGARSAAVSSDGRSVYVASTYDVAIVRFDRDTTTGALTPASCVNDNDTGDDACALSTDGLGGPSGVAVSPSGSSVYAASVFDSAIAHLGVQTTFIPRPSNVPPSNQVSFGKVKKKKRKGTATLTVEVPGPGKLDLAKTGKVKSAEKRAEAKGPEKLAIKPRGRATMKLNRKGKAKVKAKVTFTPDGGEPNTRSRRLKLIKRG
jgi:6-phosphogluconolactonase (cycloisomerase 2 family)